MNNPPPVPNTPTATSLDARRSVPARLLRAPAPDDKQLLRILHSAVRVPDHGHLTPWRIIRVLPEIRARFAVAMVDCHRAADPQVTAAQLDKDRQRFGDNTLLLVVVASLDLEHKVPEQEQLLSGGCVCFALLQAAQDNGFGAQWLTGWAAYDDGVARLLGLDRNERVLGFIHMGTVDGEVPERLRPSPADIMRDWKP